MCCVVFILSYFFLFTADDLIGLKRGSTAQAPALRCPSGQMNCNQQPQYGPQPQPINPSGFQTRQNFNYPENSQSQSNRGMQSTRIQRTESRMMNFQPPEEYRANLRREWSSLMNRDILKSRQGRPQSAQQGMPPSGMSPQ